MSWRATTGGYSGVLVRNVMLAAAENCFCNALSPPSAIESLSDSGSGYIADKTRHFALQIGMKPVMTPISSQKSDGMAESFIKTMKRDYIAFMPKPDAATTVSNPAIAFEHYNERHFYSALK